MERAAPPGGDTVLELDDINGFDQSVNSPTPKGESKSKFKRSLSQVSFKKISVKKQLARMLVSPTVFTNKALEICVELIALYLLIELNNIPRRCGLETMASCAAPMIAADPDSFDTDFFLTSCGEIRRQCRLSYLIEFNDTLIANNAQVALLNDTLYPQIEFCNCLVGDDPNDYEAVYCAFRYSTLFFLLFGVLILYGLEITEESVSSKGRNRWPRRLALLFCITYFLIASLFYWKLTSCDSPEYDEVSDVISFLGVVCFIISSVCVIIEEVGTCIHPTHKDVFDDESQ
eukprot:m.363123 g.363123  ORF g.363123 m.363123 type:complete len:289 (-) comp21508_c0_seq1:185-1051(-)